MQFEMSRKAQPRPVDLETGLQAELNLQIICGYRIEPLKKQRERKHLGRSVEIKCRLPTPSDRPEPLAVHPSIECKPLPSRPLPIIKCETILPLCVKG